MAGPIKIAILADGKQAKGEAKNVGSSLTDSLSKGLSSVKGLPALAAGTLIGGLLVKGFTDALDLEDARGKLQAQLGLSNDESAKAGKIAGDLYKGAYGDSIGDVNDMLKAVFQNGLATIGDAESKIKGITEEVATYSQITGEEATASTRAVSQILRNNLAPDAEHAFDVLTRGVQLGVDKSEDLLDTFNEYGTQFRKLGLSADDALGLMNQLIRGGARDADTAADAIKEFSIRAIDGSKTTVAGFKLIGLNAAGMAKEIGKGGPAARTAFEQTLTALNSIKDPIKRNAAGVDLFGTKWEDLGAAIGKADLKTAAKGLGDVEGATGRANDAMTTTSTKLKQVGRTIQFTLTDAIAKYALPKLNEFVTWFQGPGKFVIAAWGIDAAAAILDFSAAVVGGLKAAVGAIGDYGKVALIAAAGSVALFNPGLALNMLKQADSIGDWAHKAEDNLGKAQDALKGWSDDLAGATTRVQFEADISGLDQGIAAARTALKDPKLTATKRAKLTATIDELEAKKTAAVAALGDPKLIATRMAKLNADKRSLDTQISKAKAQLNSKDLTKERKAHLNAEISKLTAAKNRAQSQINSLHGKTVPITVSFIMKGVNPLGKFNPNGLPGRAGGGPVSAGRTYVVGENGPEIVTFGADGFVTPNRELSPEMMSDVGRGGGVVVNVYALTPNAEIGRQVVSAIQDYENFNGSSWRAA